MPACPSTLLFVPHTCTLTLLSHSQEVIGEEEEAAAAAGPVGTSVGADGADGAGADGVGAGGAGGNDDPGLLDRLAAIAAAEDPNSTPRALEAAAAAGPGLFKRKAEGEAEDDGDAKRQAL